MAVFFVIFVKTKGQGDKGGVARMFIDAMAVEREDEVAACVFVFIAVVKEGDEGEVAGLLIEGVTVKRKTEVPTFGGVVVAIKEERVEGRTVLLFVLQREVKGKGVVSCFVSFAITSKECGFKGEIAILLFVITVKREGEVAAFAAVGIHIKEQRTAPDVVRRVSVGIGEGHERPPLSIFPIEGEDAVLVRFGRECAQQGNIINAVVVIVKGQHCHVFWRNFDEWPQEVARTSICEVKRPHRKGALWRRTQVVARRTQRSPREEGNLVVIRTRCIKTPTCERK